MGRASDIRRLIALAEQFRGPAMQQIQNVQNALARRGDPAVQLERKRNRLVRRHAWASRWLTFWCLVAALAVVIAVASSVVAGAIIGIFAVTFAVRAAVRMRALSKELKAFGTVEHISAGTVISPLPPKSSIGRAPMERLAEAESTLAELLAQIGRGGSIPAESIEHTRRTGADAALVLRRVAAQLHAVERARDHAPPLERGPLADAVRALRIQLDEGVDGYGSLVAAAGRVLAASSLGGPNQELTEATEHLAGLAVALRELSPDE
jgi:hypothetical protein